MRRDCALPCNLTLTATTIEVKVNQSKDNFHFVILQRKEKERSEEREIQDRWHFHSIFQSFEGNWSLDWVERLHEFDRCSEIREAGGTLL